MPKGIIYVILNQFPCVVSNAARNTNTRTVHLEARDLWQIFEYLRYRYVFRNNMPLLG